MCFNLAWFAPVPNHNHRNLCGVRADPVVGIAIVRGDRWQDRSDDQHHPRCGGRGHRHMAMRRSDLVRAGLRYVAATVISVATRPDKGHVDTK